MPCTNYYLKHVPSTCCKFLHKFTCKSHAQIIMGGVMGGV